MIEQPRDRALARPGEAILDLLHLLGDVDMDRPLAGHRDDLAQALGRHRAQAVRRDADDGIVETRHRLAGAFEQAGIALDIVDEPPLPLRGRRAAEAALRVEDRQQRQAHAGLLRRGRDATGEFRDVGIGTAVGIVMQVVELGERGEPAFQHLHHGEGRDRLDIVRREGSEEAVHHLPPGPEAVAFRPARFGKPRHAALEGMAVQVRQARQRDAGDALAALRRRHPDAPRQSTPPSISRPTFLAQPSGRRA